MKPLSELYKLWGQLGNIPVTPKGKNIDCIEAPFLHFGAGTHRNMIWHWFEQQNPRFIVGEVQGGIRHSDDSPATLDPASRRLLEQVLASNDGMKLYTFAIQKGTGIDITPNIVKQLEQAVLNLPSSEAAWTQMRFAVDVKGVDIQKLQAAVIASATPAAQRVFARDVPGANIKALQAAVLRNGDTMEFGTFAAEVPDANITVLQDAVVARNDGFAHSWFASKVDGANIQVLQAACIRSGDPRAMVDFAVQVNNADVLALWHAVCDTGNERAIDEFRKGLGRVVDQLMQHEQKVLDFGKLLAKSGDSKLIDRYQSIFGEPVASDIKPKTKPATHKG